MSITKFYNKQTDTYYAYETTFESKELLRCLHRILLNKK